MKEREKKEEMSKQTNKLKKLKIFSSTSNKTGEKEKERGREIENIPKLFHYLSLIGVRPLLLFLGQIFLSQFFNLDQRSVNTQMLALTKKKRISGN